MQIFLNVLILFLIFSANNCYELPKLLIRKDSPVESFHSSDPQLKTMVLRGDSPKNTLESFPKLNNNDGSNSALNTSIDTDHIHHNGSKSSVSGTILKSPWSHHHSDLGLNNLELNFLNDELSDCEGASCLKKSNSVLKIASNLEINKWKTSAEFDENSPHSATSLNFINGDVSSSDEDDAFNSSCELLHSNSKSKSVELNEFRMMFGSSPTLLNFNHPIAQTSRLDAVPFQYRRGYTNLNDACLSSSTSDLECFHDGSTKNMKGNGHHHGCGGGSGGGQELSSLLRHRNNGHLDYVRSYENLDRTRIVRMKSEKKNSLTGGIGSGGGGTSTDNCCRGSSGGNLNSFGIDSSAGSSRNDWKFHNHFERERVQEEDSGDDYSYSNFGYDNAVGSIGNFPVGYQSNESIFNINFDSVEDNIFEINKLALFEPSDLQVTKTTGTTTTSTSSQSPAAAHNSRIMLDDKCEIDTFTVPDLSKLKIVERIKPLLMNVNTDILNNKQISSASRSASSTTLLKRETDELISQPLPATPPKKPQKLRCAECNKKLGVIMVMKCHCEQVFCAQHRYAEAHNCSYNFKVKGKQILARENPLVIAQKLPKI